MLSGIRAIADGVVKGLAIIAICLYTIGCSLTIVKVISPVDFLRSTMTVAMVGWPAKLIAGTKEG